MKLTVAVTESVQEWPQRKSHGPSNTKVLNHVVITNYPKLGTNIWNGIYCCHHKIKFCRLSLLLCRVIMGETHRHTFNSHSLSRLIRNYINMTYSASESNSGSNGERICMLPWNSKCHCLVHKIPPLENILYCLVLFAHIRCFEMPPFYYKPIYFRYHTKHTVTILL